MKIGLFIDSVMCLDSSGRPYPLRDPFLHFISEVAREAEGLTIASRCLRRDPESGENVEHLPGFSNLSFVPLPFYANTEEHYRKRRAIWAQSEPIVREVIRNADVVMIRVHHCLAVRIASLAEAAGKPFVLFWSGPVIIESARQNYPSWRPKHVAARLLARWEMLGFRRLAVRAAANLFLDRNEHRRMGSPPRSEWVLESRVSGESIVQSPRTRRGTTLRILFAGRLFRHKGIFDLLQALRALQDEGVDFTLTVAGHGPDRDRFASAVNELGLTSRVSLLGNKRFDEVQSLLRESDVFVLPSYAEGMPKAILESWAAGTTVVSTDVGTIGYYLNDRKNGRLLKPGDVEALTQALRSLAADEDERLRYATAGIETIRQHTIDQEIDIIQRTLGSVRARRPVSP